MLCALVLSGAAFAGEPGFTPVEPASPNAEGIKQSYMWVALFTGAIFVLVGQLSGLESPAPVAAQLPRRVHPRLAAELEHVLGRDHRERGP